MKKILLVTLIILLAPLPASAQSNLDFLLSAKTIKCTIKEGGTSEFDGENISFERGKFSKNPEDSIATYVKIDTKQGTALIIGNAGTDEPRAGTGGKGATDCPAV